MQYFVTKDVLPTQSIDCIAVAVFEGNQLSPAAATLNTARWLNESAATQAVSCLAEAPVKERTTAWKIRQTIINTETALYRYSQTKSQFKPVEKPLTRLGFMASEADIDTLEKACDTGAAIGRGMNLARELGNLPGNICTPKSHKIRTGFR